MFPVKETWFQLLLLQYEASNRSGEALWHLAFNKAKSLATILCAVPIEILSCSEISSILTLLSANISRLIESIFQVCSPLGAQLACLQFE